MRLTLQPIDTTLAPAHPRRFLCLFSALLFTFTAVLAHAQEYTSIVIFGDSLSDTGNVAHLTQKKHGLRIPGPGPLGGNYTDGRFTDGDDTIPAAQKYFGLWVEQFAALLPAKPIIKNSLDGGTDYAYGSATTGNGTTLVTLGPSLRQRQQHGPADNGLSRDLSGTLTIGRCSWSGVAANDLLNATSADAIFTGSHQPGERTSSASSMLEPPSSSSLTSRRWDWFPRSTGTPRLRSPRPRQAPSLTSS